MLNREIYQVLARKYRPKDFLGLIGQDSLVKILSNSIVKQRVAHAFLLTGIRGTGKTTTARLIAKTINCTSRKIENSIVIPCEACLNCEAYKKNNHPDLIELDAASRTGVGDIREIIETVQYLPSLGKYKFYVIDEVHMLSNNAFNALLKTLEEPPAHVKFILATTELRKIPLTIISRCQRFDLARIQKDLLIQHIENISFKEGFTIERAASSLIAEAASGSARDSLSLLDNAFSYIGEDVSHNITAETVKKMLGITSPTLLYNLFNFIVDGGTNQAIAQLQEIYFLGTDLLQLFEDLLEVITLTTKFYYNENLLLPQRFEELKLYAPSWISKVNIEFLTILWQMIVKGLQEIKNFSNSLQVSEMIIIRLCHVSELPLPSELTKKLKFNTSELSLPLEVKKKPKPINFDQVLNLFKINKEMVIYHHLYEDVQLVSFTDNKIQFKVNGYAPKDLAQKVQMFLERWTEEKWSVIFSERTGQQTIKEQKNNEKQEMITIYERENSLVKDIYTKFPGAKIIDIKIKENQ